MVYASVMLEKWQKKGLEFLKFLQTVTTAHLEDARVVGFCMMNSTVYGRHAFPAYSWGVVDSELWMLCVTTPK